MLHIAICEDDPVFMDYETTLIDQLLTTENVAYQLNTYSASTDLLKALESGAVYDMLLLDIDIPVMNGISLGMQAKRILPDSIRIYISAKTDLVFDSFAAQPFAFVPKDQVNERIGSVLESAIRDIADRHQDIVLDTGKGRLQTDVESLRYAEALGRKVFLHINDTDVEVSTQLKVLEEELGPHGFLRIHKSFLVNYREIFSINKDVVVLKNGQGLPLSKHRAPAIRSQYLLLTSD